MAEFISVFLNVILPVFTVVLIGALSGKKLELEARTLTRTAYYIFVPAFPFQAISTAQIPFSSAIKMLAFIVLTHLCAVVLAGAAGVLLGRSKKMIAAFIMIASFGNVGNYGLAVIRFRLGEAAVAPTTIYFVSISMVAFVICVGAAGWAHGGSRGAVWNVAKTPALWSAFLAGVVSAGDIELPLMVWRMIGLLADGMIPVMLFSLGLQLSEQGRIQLNGDVFLGAGLRLIVTPLLAWIIVKPFNLGALESASGILEAAMPAAVLVSIIAKENNIVPSFVTSVVVVSTLLSVATLSVIMVLL